MIPLGPRQFRRLAAIAELRAGLHMPEGKQYFMASRLQRRLRANGLTDFDDYLSLLDSGGGAGPLEMEAMVSALTTNVTEVFREAHHFSLLAESLAAAFLRPASLAGAPIRPAPGRSGDRYLIWSAGCSTGEEPLSIAAVCHAVLGEGWTRHVRILATDVDGAVLDAARDRRSDAALAGALRNLPPGIADHAPAWPADPVEWMRSLHAGITVIQHNLLNDLDLPGRFEAIFCRNVTIYFSRETQERVHAMLLGRLANGGLLALGHSERLFVCDSGLTSVGRTAFRYTAPVREPHWGKVVTCR